MQFIQRIQKNMVLTGEIVCAVNFW